MNVKRTLLSAILLYSVKVISLAQPAGYYDNATGKSGEQLQQALHDIIDNHTQKSYSYLWTAFQSTDKKSDGTVWDMYSDNPDGAEPYVWTFGSDQCGNAGGEGDCYNREHSFPKSWFGGEIYPMNSDLFHLYPTDGYVNNRRSNYPFGETDSPTWTSLNGSKVGSSSVTGYNGTIFEPIDEYKGDFARTYFYMATRYYGEDSSWPGSPMVDGSQLKPWAKAMLIQWHNADPVSDKEEDRNDAVYTIQNNRNPYIDHPEYVALLYGGEIIDEYPPEIDSIVVNSHDELVLWFNEPLDPVSALDIENYQISSLVSIEDASFKSAANNAVVLELSSMSNGNYVLTITSVKDTADNAMSVAFYSFEVNFPIIQPECYDDIVSMNGGSSFSYLVLYNDILPGPGVLSITRQPTHGSAAVEAGNIVTYIPDPGFNHQYDTIGYKVCLESNPQACDSAMMIVHVDKAVGFDPNLEERSVSIYPNPNQGDFYLNYPGNPSDIQSVRIHDMSGRDLPLEYHETGDGIKISSSLKPGVYHLSLALSDGRRMWSPLLVQ